MKMRISSIVVAIVNGEEDSDGDNDDVPKPSTGFTKTLWRFISSSSLYLVPMGGLDLHRLAKIQRMNYCMNGIKYLGLFGLPL